MMTTKRCDFCNGHHDDRECYIERLLAPFMSQLTGLELEKYVEECLHCPYCGKKELNILKDSSPSLDAVCGSCNEFFEVKSKCLSAHKLPDDLHLNHGNYNLYKQRQEKGLNFIIIIYGANRKTKVLKIKKIFFIPSKQIGGNNNNFKVVKKNNNLSKILIDNHTKFKKYNINKIPLYINYADKVNQKLIELITMINNGGINNYQEFIKYTEY
jgi:hypothetical protein